MIFGKILSNDKSLVNEILGSIFCEVSLNYRRLNAVPANKEYAAGTVPANKEYAAEEKKLPNFKRKLRSWVTSNISI